MTIEAIGIFTIGVGLLCLLLPYGYAAIVLIIFTVFGAAAAILIGQLTIQPGHLFLAFAAVTIFSHKALAAAALRGLSPKEAGFWILSLWIYGAVLGFLVPRVMKGQFEIIPLGVSEHASNGSTVPLGPVSSNLTQALYLAGDILCFCMVVAVGSTKAGMRALASGLIAYAAINVMLAIADLVTDATGTADILGFMRNANYTLHIDDEVAGLKRIVGSWPEASAFASTSFGPFAFTAVLWMSGYRSWLTGSLALVSLLFIVLSTSSAGFATLPVALALLYYLAIRGCGISAVRQRNSAVVFFAPLIVAGLAIAILMIPEAYSIVYHYVDTLLLNKQSSQSGIERASWNTSGWQNFLDSTGFGVGLGTVRTSSFGVALLSNVGIPGLVFYAVFMSIVLFRSHAGEDHEFAAIRLAARAGCLSMLAAHMLVASTVDQGLLFYVLAGIACCNPQLERATARDPGFAKRLPSAMRTSTT